jgi:hypothetical protein
MGKEYNRKMCFLFMNHPFCMVGWWVLVYLGHNNYGVHNLIFGHKWRNPLLKGKRYKERQGNSDVHNLSQFLGYEISKSKLYSSLLLL